MSATRAPSEPAAAPHPPTPDGAVTDPQIYFRLIEEAFLRLRGAALLLAPADWQAARRWHELGIPADLVIATMESAWRRRLERAGPPARLRRINSLRYFAPAVEAAWEEVARLTAAGRRWEESPIDAPARLERLSAALPEHLAGREEWAARIRALGGDNQRIEEGLAEIDRALALAIEERLGEQRRAEISATVERRLAPLAARLASDQLAEARQRLFSLELRAAHGLPVLSLFSPAASEPE